MLQPRVMLPHIQVDSGHILTDWLVFARFPPTSRGQEQITLRQIV